VTVGVGSLPGRAVSFAGAIAQTLTPGSPGTADGGATQPEAPDLAIPKELDAALRAGLGELGYSIEKETLASRDGDLRREVLSVNGPRPFLLFHIAPGLWSAPAKASQAIGPLEYLLPAQRPAFLFSSGVNELPSSVTSLLEQWSRGGVEVTFKGWQAVTSLAERTDRSAAVAELLELPVPEAARRDGSQGPAPSVTVAVFVAHDEADAKEQYLQEMIDFLKGGLRRDGFEFSLPDDIPSGEDRDQWVREAFDRANLLLAVVTQNLLNSDLNERIAAEAERRQGVPWVYPVLLAPCDWEAYAWVKAIEHQPKEGTVGEKYSNKWKRQALFTSMLKEMRERKAKVALR
jgi:hypothetical protein